ncbi:hypothetical protein LCGC14_1298230, partial [marine sediment metagenome]
QWMLASVYVLLFLLNLKDKPALVARRGFTVLAGTFFLFSAFLLAYHEVVSAQMELLISYQRPGLRRWGESFISTFFFQTHPFVTIFAIVSAFVAFRRKDIRWLVTAWLVLLVLVMRIERSRYMVPLFPMLAITAAYGLNAFIAAIIGGIGNIPGAMIGGLLLGLFSSLASGYISSTWQQAIVFGLLILILMVRPTGILGERVADKV